MKDLDFNRSMEIRCCLYGKGKSYYLWNNAQSYYKKLGNAFEDINSDIEKDYLYPSFIALCSATLEYSLNFMYALYCFRHFEYENYQTYLDSYKNMRFKNKLFMLPYILSEGKFMTNEDYVSIKLLYDLISKRNALLHNSEKLKIFDFPDLKASIIDNNLFVPIENCQVEFSISAEDNIIDSINKDDCIKIGNAMFDFCQQIIIPYINQDELAICYFVKENTYY